MKKHLALLILILVFTGCNSKKTTTGPVGATTTRAGDSYFEVLKKSEYGGREAASETVIKTQAELNLLYKELSLGAAPVVDFSKKNVVAIFIGQKSTGGYSVGIKNVSVDGDTATVTLFHKAPDGMATMVLTQPYCIAVVIKTPKIEFN